MENKNIIAKSKFESATEAFTSEAFSKAANFYHQSGRIYNELKMKNNAFMAFYQALNSRRREFPEFLNEEKQDFLRSEYLQELRDFVINFSEFEEENEYYKEKYIKQKYRYLLANSFKNKSENDIGATSKTLFELANFVMAYSDIFSGEQYQVINVFRWRMMAEQNQIKMLKLKGESASVIAKECKRVADICNPPQQSNSPFLEEVKAQQSNFYADSFKYLAFSNFEKRRVSITDRKNALENMEKALCHAQNAKTFFDEIDKKKGISYIDNVRYLSYWYNIFLTCISVIDKEFDKAQNALESAISDAGYFISLKKEDDIFPNYYADFDDLQNEELIIASWEKLINDKAFQASADFLSQWLDRSGERHSGSWRFNNISIRFLVVSILALLPLINDRREECAKKIEEIDDILEKSFVGAATRKLVTYTKDMVKYVETGDIAINDDHYRYLIDQIFQYFPIETTTQDFRIVESRRESVDPFEDLPPYFSECLEKPDNLQELTKNQTVKAYEKLRDGFRLYLLLITEFHYKRYMDFMQKGTSFIQQLPDDFDNEFLPMTIGKLVEALGWICKALDNKGKRFGRFQKAFYDLDTLSFPDSNQAVEMSTLEELFDVISGIIIPKSYMRFFPHIVQVTESYDVKGRKAIKVVRIWRKGVPETLNIYGPELELEQNAYYCLTPRWKRYGRVSVDTRSKGYYICKSAFYSKTVAIAEKNIGKALIDEITKCPKGKGHQYQEICIKILRFLFVPPFDYIKPESVSKKRKIRIDAIGQNTYNHHRFWANLREKHKAYYIVFEFKNYSKDIEPGHVDQVAKYLIWKEEEYGKLGIIISRKKPPDNVVETRNEWYEINKTIILFLWDKHLIEAIKNKEDGKEPEIVIKKEYEEFTEKV